MAGLHMPALQLFTCPTMYSSGMASGSEDVHDDFFIAAVILVKIFAGLIIRGFSTFMTRSSHLVEAGALFIVNLLS